MIGRRFRFGGALIHSLFIQMTHGGGGNIRLVFVEHVERQRKVS
jgi:hypothetical protein